MPVCTETPPTRLPFSMTRTSCPAWLPGWRRAGRRSTAYDDKIILHHGPPVGVRERESRIHHAAVRQRVAVLAPCVKPAGHRRAK